MSSLSKLLIKPESRSIFYIAFLTLAFSLATSPIAQIVSHDRDIFRYIGMLLSKGYIPYRSVFELRMPMIFFVAATGLNLGAWWGYWLVLTIVLMISAIALYKLLKHLHLPYAFLCVCVYLSYMQWSPMADYGNLAYNLSASLVTIFLYVFFVTDSLMLLGIIAGLIFCTQPNDILSLLPLFIYKTFWNQELKKINTTKIFASLIMKITVGFLLVFTIVSSYFIYHHAFGEMIDSALIFPFTYYMPNHSHNMFHIIKPWITTGSETLFIALFANLFYCRKSACAFKNIILMTAVSILLQLVSASLSGKFYWHYYLAYTPYLILQASIFLKNIDPYRIIKTIYIGLLASTVLIFGIYVFYTTSHYYRLLSDRNGYHITTPYQAQIKPYVELLNNLSKKYGPITDGQLYIYQNSGLFSLYTELRVVAPTKWLEPDFLSDYDFDKTGEKFASIVRDINTNRTRYILDFSSSTHIPSDKHEVLWKPMLRQHYMKIAPLPCIVRQLSDKAGNAVCGWVYVRTSSNTKNVTVN